MNKKRNIYVEILCGIVLVLILGNSYMRNVYDTKKTVTKKMKAYLKEKYKEDFEIYALRAINGGYTAYIIPSNDVNTPKGDDDFYEATVAMQTKSIYFLGQHMFNLHKDLIDTQWRVEIKEKFNALIGKEMEKLFGKNYLTALEMKLTRDILKKEKFSHTMTEEDIRKILNRNEIEISGGIYIFGRVENEADREYYRKQIYEFIQYLKAEGMFDYTLLKIRIIDERALTKGYRNNDNNISENLIELVNNKSLDRKEYSEKRVNLMSQFDIEYNKMTDKEKEEVLNKYSKAALGESYIKVFGKGTPLLSFFTYSPKYIISRGWDKDKNSDDYEKVKYYDKLEEVDLSEGW